MVTASGVIADQAADSTATPPELTVIVPTRNERDNIAPLVARLAGALSGMDWEVLFGR